MGSLANICQVSWKDTCNLCYQNQHGKQISMNKGMKAICLKDECNINLACKWYWFTSSYITVKDWNIRCTCTWWTIRGIVLQNNRWQIKSSCNKLSCRRRLLDPWSLLFLPKWIRNLKCMKKHMEEKKSKIVVKSETADVTSVLQNTLAPKNRCVFFPD